MPTLTTRQLAQQDFVDNQIFELLQKLFPMIKIKWDIEIIGAVRDVIQKQVSKKYKSVSDKSFYP